VIRRAVDFALQNRLLVLAVAILLFIWGVISFRSLPVEAYPDVANNYVQVITQWPGISAEHLASVVFPNGAKEWHNPPIGWLTEAYAAALGITIRWR